MPSINSGTNALLGSEPNAEQDFKERYEDERGSVLKAYPAKLESQLARPDSHHTPSSITNETF